MRRIPLFEMNLDENHTDGSNKHDAQLNLFVLAGDWRKETLWLRDIKQMEKGAV